VELRASTIAVDATASDDRAVKHLGLRAWPAALLMATLIIVNQVGAFRRQSAAQAPGIQG
jgi:hypothetical protein